MNRLARAVGESCCLAERTRIGEADVRGKFTRDLITKPYAALEIGQSRSNPPSTIYLTVEIHFDLRLEYQALTEIQIVRALDSSRDPRSIAKIQRWFKIEEVTSESLYSDCKPCASWTGIEINPRTRLPVKVPHVRNRPVVENFVVSIAGDSAVTVPSDLIHNLLKSVPIQPWPSHRKLVFGPSVLPSSSSKVMKVNTRLSSTGLGQFDAGVGTSTGIAGACAQTGFTVALVHRAPAMTSCRASRPITTPVPYETCPLPCDIAGGSGKPSVRVCPR